MSDAPLGPGGPPTSPEPVEPATGGGVLIEERPAPTPGDGDHERFAHYVRKDKIVDAMVGGTPVVALCGKKWVPSRDPSKFPVCPDCKRIYEDMPRGRDDEGGSGGDAGAGG